MMNHHQTIHLSSLPILNVPIDTSSCHTESNAPEEEILLDKFTDSLFNKGKHFSNADVEDSNVINLTGNVNIHAVTENNVNDDLPAELDPASIAAPMAIDR